MTTIEMRNRPAAAAEAQELNSKAAQQVSDILEQAQRSERIAKPAVAYRMPAPGVRCYF